jgi:hypothetical protein
VLYYTCPSADVGSTVELSFGGSKLEIQVTAANDPPLVGEQHDRVPRVGESYMKDFKPLRVGVLPLDQHRGTLTLRAVRIPGKQVMEVRSVVLKLLN